jgi:hypothetical protein
MKRRLPLLLALLLPLLGLLATIARNEMALSGASAWQIPVEGYDPRDILRGHYVTFRYRWQVEGDTVPCANGQCLICLERQDGDVIARILPRQSAPACRFRVDPVASHIASFGRDFTGRIYVSEASAPALQTQLTKGQMTLDALLGEDGRLVNQRLRPPGQ